MTPNSGLQISAQIFMHANPHMHVHTQNKMQFYLDSVTGKGGGEQGPWKECKSEKKTKKKKDEIIKGMN